MGYMSEKVSLLNASLHQVRAGWSDRLEIDISSLQNPGLTFVAREGSYGVTILKFFDSTIAICQPSLLPILSLLSPANLLDMPLLLKVLSGRKINPVGIASISYADENTLKGAQYSDATHLSNLQEAQSILSSCTESEQEESGIAEMSFYFATDSANGKAGAIAGYEVWNGKIAQLGVVTRPEHRGQGLASMVAHTAAKSAIDTGLIAQWRCQLGNMSSYQLSQKLGFHEVGLQLAIDVAPSSN